jgi:hypothetical protein
VPDSPLTADVRGEAGGAGYVDSHGAVMVRGLTTWAGLNIADLDTGSFASLPIGAMGLYLTEFITGEEFMEVLCTSCFASWRTDALGRIRVDRYKLPEQRSPSLSLDETNAVRVGALPLPQPPRWRQRVNYRRNWTQQTGADLASSVSATDRQFYEAPWRTLTVTAPATQTRYPFAPDPAPLDTLFDEAADAEALADLLIDLFAPDRALWAVSLRSLGLAVDLNGAVALSCPRYGLATPRTFIVRRRRIDQLTGEVLLELWG